MIEVKIISAPQNKKIYEKLCNISNNFKEGIHQGYIILGEYLIRTNKRDFRAPKSGRIYRYRLNGRLINHQASAPGEPPARLTGKLESSLKIRTPGATSMTYSAGTDEVIYAKFLEEGTIKMAPRPFMSKSVRDNQGLAVQTFYEQIGSRLV